MTKERIEQLPEILKSHICTLKKASRDTTNKVSMCESELKAVDFDKIPDEYARGKKWCCVPNSNDALYIDKNGTWYFIEFKNGSIERGDIYRKIYDSIIMLIELGVIPDFNFARNQIQYILVYNSDKFSHIGEAEGLKRIYNHALQQANTERKMFQVWKLEQYLLKETHTYTRELFDEKFIQPMEQMEAS